MSYVVSLGNVLVVELANVLLEARGQTGVHGGTTREHNVVVKGLTKIHVSTVDAVEEGLRDAHAVTINEAGGEEALGGEETLTTEMDHTTIREFVLGHKDSGVVGELVF